MLSHLLTLAARSLWRHRATSAINLVALSLGLLCFALAAAFATAIDKADSRWPNAERIAVVTERVDKPGNDWEGIAAAFVAPMTARYLKTDYPEIEAVSTFRPMGLMPVEAGKAKIAANVHSADEDFTRVFTWPLREGEWHEALSRPNGAVIGPSIAKALFGNEDPLGKSFTLQGHDLIVTGVTGRFPDQMTVFSDWHLVLVSSEIGEALRQHATPPGIELWEDRPVQAFVLLPAGLSVRDFDKRLAAFAGRHIPAERGNFSFGAITLPDLTADMFRGMALVSLSRLFLLLGALVLGVACLNYVNLASGLVQTRRPEMAMRRILGESRLSIVGQILFECALLSILALILVLGMLALLVPVTANQGYNGASLTTPLTLPAFWGRLALGTAAAIFAGGLYPAFVLSRGDGRIGAGRRATQRFLPATLVAVQFLLGSLLIIGVLAMGAQSDFMRRAIDPPDEDMVVISFNMPTDPPLSQLRERLLALPRVRAVSSSGMPLFQAFDVEPYRRADDPAAPKILAIGNTVNDDFFETLGARFIAGRDFSPDRADESGSNHGPGPLPVVIDRSLAQAFGWSPAEAVGREIATDGRGPNGSAMVIGVIEDRLTASNTRAARGAVYQHVSNTSPNGLFRIARQDSAATIEAMTEVLRGLSSFAQPSLQPLAVTLEWNDRAIALLKYLRGLAAFAFLIGVIGLAGMALHVTARRRREIGIRRTLGASRRQIVALLLRDFAGPVLLGNLLAWPIAFIGERLYLALFIQHIPFSPLPFAIALGVSLLVAGLAVIWQSARAAGRNPAETLHYE